MQRAHKTNKMQQNKLRHLSEARTSDMNIAFQNANI